MDIELEARLFRWLAYEPTLLGARLDILRELGLFTDDDAERWRQLVEATHRPYAAPAEVRERAVRYLERLPELRDYESRQEYIDTISMFNHLGVLDLDSVPAMRVLPSNERDAEDDEPPTRFVRRIDVTARRSAGFRLLTVDMYTQSITVHWDFDAANGDMSMRTKLTVLESMRNGADERYISITDDAGTHYEEDEAESERPDAEVATGWDRFLPAPPPHARTLTVRLGDASFDVDLGGGD